MRNVCRSIWADIWSRLALIFLAVVVAICLVTLAVWPHGGIYPAIIDGVSACLFVAYLMGAWSR